mmetsp:Transcript_59003/g.157767  ORF Transcript_59003/g.157767 Transcript_59003/m.157767 type:complete len:431 (-) Transcript_59003:360-1652(-)
MSETSPSHGQDAGGPAPPAPDPPGSPTTAPPPPPPPPPPPAPESEIVVKELLNEPRACGYFDYQTVEGLRYQVLLTTCEAAQLATVGVPFAKTEKVAAQELEKLLQHLNAGIGQAPATNEPTIGLQRLRHRLDSYLEQKTGFLARRMLDPKTQRERGKQLLHKLEKTGEGTEVLSALNRHEQVHGLIRAYDTESLGHCSEVLHYEQDLVTHRLNCSFRPVQCECAGCDHVCSYSKLQTHDRICPYKPIPCVQGCGLAIIRANMQQHVEGPCGFRLVPCPYAGLGCTEEVRQGDYLTHLECRAYAHLALVLARQDQLADRLDSFGSALQAAGVRTDETAGVAETLIASVRQEVHQLADAAAKEREKSSRLEKELSNTKRELASTTAALKEMKKEVTGLKTFVDEVRKREKLMEEQHQRRSQALASGGHPLT